MPPILIDSAGSVGLTLAAELSRPGGAVRLLDRNPAPAARVACLAGSHGGRHERNRYRLARQLHDPRVEGRHGGWTRSTGPCRRLGRPLDACERMGRGL